MQESTGESDRALAGARAALAAGDEVLAGADRVLAETLASARAVAAESVRRIDVVRAGVDAVLARGPVEGPVEARQFAAFMAAGHREVIAVVTEAGATASAKAAVLQEICARYQSLMPAGTR